MPVVRNLWERRLLDKAFDTGRYPTRKDLEVAVKTAAIQSLLNSITKVSSGNAETAAEHLEWYGEMQNFIDTGDVK